MISSLQQEDRQERSYDKPGNISFQSYCCTVVREQQQLFSVSFVYISYEKFEDTKDHSESVTRRTDNTMDKC